MRPLLSPVAMATGWATARSTVIDSMPSMAAAASEICGYNKRAYIYLGTVTLAALTIRLST